MLLFIDGFDHYASDDVSKKWDDVNVRGWNNIYVKDTNPRRAGTRYLSIDSSYNYALFKYFVSCPTVVVGFAFWCDTFTVGGHHGFYLGNSSDCQLVFRINQDGSISVGKANSYGGDIATLLGTTAAGVLSPNTWQYIELKATAGDGTAGAIVIHVNEVEVLNLSGIDTHSIWLGGFEDLNYSVLHLYKANYSAEICFDDLYIANTTGGAQDVTDFLGDQRIDTLYPNAAGNYTQWAPSAAPNYSCCDDPGDINDDTDYVTSSNLTDKDTYNIDNIVALGTQINGVASNVCIRKTDAQQSRFKHITRQGGADYKSSEVSITDNYKVKQRTHDTDPDTGVRWTESGVDNVEIGFELTTI